MARRGDHDNAGGDATRTCQIYGLNAAQRFGKGAIPGKARQRAKLFAGEYKFFRQCCEIVMADDAAHMIRVFMGRQNAFGRGQCVLRMGPDLLR